MIYTTTELFLSDGTIIQLVSHEMDAPCFAIKIGEKILHECHIDESEIKDLIKMLKMHIPEKDD